MSRTGEALLARAPGCLHMAGAGGVGMAGLALLMRQQGWRVSGCDAAEGSLVPWLRQQGIPVAVGHDPGHLDVDPPDAIIRSPAVVREEAELREAARRGIPVLDRGEVLPVLLRAYRTAAIAGTHGKTTTASMLAWILEKAGRHPSFCIGGVCPNLGMVARAAAMDAMVVEADESDGTLRWYRPDVAVITSVDLDHVDYFPDEAALTGLYRAFAAASRVVVRPHAAPALTSSDRTFGLAEGADVQAVGISLSADGSCSTLVIDGAPAGSLVLGVSGEHNVLNALAATAAAQAWSVPVAVVLDALSSFQLPRRRFEEVARGRGLRMISDYAHHPVEIAALLAQARLQKPRRLIGVFQPHRYSRTRAFKKEFAGVLSSLDYLVLAPVYAASEPEMAGGTSRDLYEEFLSPGEGGVELAGSLEEAWSKLNSVAREGDLILLIGAGDVEIIGTWASRMWDATGG